MRIMGLAMMRPPVNSLDCLAHRRIMNPEVIRCLFHDKETREGGNGGSESLLATISTQSGLERAAPRHRGEWRPLRRPGRRRDASPRVQYLQGSNYGFLQPNNPLYVTGDDLTPDAPRVGISFFFRYYQHFKILGR